MRFWTYYQSVFYAPFVQQYLSKPTLERQAYTVVGYDKGRLKEEQELDKKW